MIVEKTIDLTHGVEVESCVRPTVPPPGTDGNVRFGINPFFREISAIKRLTIRANDTPADLVAAAETALRNVLRAVDPKADIAYIADSVADVRPPYWKNMPGVIATKSYAVTIDGASGPRDLGIDYSGEGYEFRMRYIICFEIT